MNVLYENQQRRLFKQWKEKIKVKLPELVSKFYKSEQYKPYEYHVMLGKIIADINNPFYSFQDEKLNNTDSESELCLRILLKIQVEGFIEYVNRLK